LRLRQFNQTAKEGIIIKIEHAEQAIHNRFFFSPPDDQFTARPQSAIVELVDFVD